MTTSRPKSRSPDSIVILTCHVYVLLLHSLDHIPQGPDDVLLILVSRPISFPVHGIDSIYVFKISINYDLNLKVIFREAYTT